MWKEVNILSTISAQKHTPSAALTYSLKKRALNNHKNQRNGTEIK